MDESSDFKLNEVCRICLSKINNMLNIMETNSRNSNIISMLQSIGHFEIVLNDFLPKYLCKECEKQLVLSYNFQKILQKNNEYLMKCFNEKFLNNTTTNDSDYRLETKLEIPKDEPPDSDVYDEPSPINVKEIYNEEPELHKFVDDSVKMIIDDIDGDDDNNSDGDDVNDSMESSSEFKKMDTKAVENFLPDKSRKRYENSYKIYKDWCLDENVETTTENVLIAYFSDLSKTKKASTLWSLYSMLRTTLNINENIDISKFQKLKAFLKKQSVGFQPKKSNVFSQNDIDTFLSTAPFEFLSQKVALVLGVSGACRSDELFKMKVNDLQFIDDNKLSVTIPKTKTYTSRTFIISNIEWLKIVKEYLNLRKNIDNNRLFMQIRYGKITKQPFGHNTIASFPKKIATFLNLSNPETFTGHCFRRTAATLLVDNGGDTSQLKSTTVSEECVDNSLSGQSKAEKMISNAMVNDDSAPGCSEDLTIDCKEEAAI